MATKRWVLSFLVWLAVVVVLYRIPAPLTASQAYPVPTSPYPGPREAYLPWVMQGNAAPGATATSTVPLPGPTATVSPTATGVVQPSPTPPAGRFVPNHS